MVVFRFHSKQIKSVRLCLIYGFVALSTQIKLVAPQMKICPSLVAGDRDASSFPP